MLRVVYSLAMILGASSGHADVLDQVDALLQRGSSDSARALLERTAFASDSNRLRFLRGRLEVSGGRAKKHFRTITRSGGPFSEDAHFELAEAAYTDPNGLYLTARRTYRSLIDAYPDSRYVPLALYRIGRTHQITAGTDPSGGAAQIDSARAVFQEVIGRFPGSEPAKLSQFALVEAHLQAGDRARADTDSKRLSRRPVWAGQTSLYEGLGLGEQPEEVASGAFWVQVGAFASRRSVDGLVKRLTGTVPSVRTVASGALTLVQVGPYSTRERAERSSDHISNAESLTCRVIQD